MSISLHMGTDVVRENFLLVMVAIKWESILERTASVVKPELH